MLKIAICIVTYNQENYISQAIESVLMQVVSIPFTIFIGEDCSSDHTREICIDYKNKFPDKIKLMLNETNQGLVKNTISILKKIIELNYQYIAILDGDDYWTDEFKLNKEIVYLEQNPDYGLVHTNVAILNNDQIIKNKAIIPQGDVFSQMGEFPIANSTVLFRTSLLKLICFDDFVKYQFLSCDYVMYAVFSKYTKFGFIDDYTAIWRRGHNSVSNSNNMERDIQYIENDLRMWKYLYIIFPNRFGYNEEAANKHKEYRKFNIAFRYKNYSLAHEIFKNGNLPKRNFIFEIKKIAATNTFFFNLWFLLKK
jgi:glycosyltransferase involved in cell wall biosynthesis